MGKMKQQDWVNLLIGVIIAYGIFDYYLRPKLPAFLQSRILWLVILVVLGLATIFALGYFFGIGWMKRHQK